MGLQEVAGGGGGAESGVDDGSGGLAVQGDAQRVGDGAVDGGGDEGVDELQPGLRSVVRGSRGGSGGREDARVPQAGGGAGGLLGAEGGDACGDVLGDGGAEDGAGPGEADGGGAEAFEAGDEAAAALGGGEVGQLRGVLLDGSQSPAPDLGGEFDGFEGVAGGDGPGLVAEGVVGVFADGVADERGDGGRGERGEGQRALSRPARQRAEGIGVRGQFVGAVGDDEEQREVFGARGEGGEPAQGLGVGPVRVVEDEGDGGAFDDEVGEDPVEAVAQALGVGRGALFGGAESEGGADDGVPAPEGGAQLLFGGAGELGLDELAGDVEGLALLLFAAAGGEDGAGAGVGAAAQFGEQGGLAEAGGPGEGQQGAAGVRPGTGELVQGLVDDGEFGIAFDHGAPYARPVVRHGWYPPGLFREISVRPRTSRGIPLSERIRSSFPTGFRGGSRRLSEGVSRRFRWDPKPIGPVRNVPRVLPGRPRPRRPGRRPRRDGRGGIRR